jgi:acetoin utilization protein AcuB
MLIKEIMTKHPVVIEPTMPVTRAERLLKEHGIRHLPVVHERKGMVGLITRNSLSRALPSEMSTLSIWELNYQLSQIKAEDVMVKRVISIHEDATVEQAARIMIDRKIGSLPVLREEDLIGIVTDVDLLDALSNLMGWRQPGIRLTVQVPDETGRLAKVATAIAEAGGLLVGGGSYNAEESLRANIVFKVRHLTLQQLSDLVSGMEWVEVLDLREA